MEGSVKITIGFILFFLFVFFFKQKTAYEIYQCDWSSDVCSSDLAFHLRRHSFLSFLFLPFLPLFAHLLPTAKMKGDFPPPPFSRALLRGRKHVPTPLFDVAGCPVVGRVRPAEKGGPSKCGGRDNTATEAPGVVRGKGSDFFANHLPTPLFWGPDFFRPRFRRTLSATDS